MDDIITRPAEEISREELHELIWQIPMSKLRPQLDEPPKLGSSLSKAPNPYAALGLAAEKGCWPCSRDASFAVIRTAPQKPPLQSGQHGRW